MNELLKKLLEAEVLSEETKKELEEAINSQIAEAVESAKKEAREQVRVELTERWITERDALIEAIDEKIEDYLKQEFTELKEDIAAFRDLEAEYAKRLVEAKGVMAEELQKDLAELIEKLDSFLEIRLNAEFEELREDIEEAKKLQFGKKVFEAFIEEYRHNFIDENSTEAELREVRKELDDIKKKKEAAEEEVKSMKRKAKMEKVLKPLSGKQREIMETILDKVPTESLEEAYRTFIGRVLKESEDKGSEKEDTVLAESKSKIAEEAKIEEVVVKTGNLVDGNAIEEDRSKSAKTVTVTESWKRLAGLA